MNQRRTNNKEEDLTEEEKKLRKQLAEETLVSKRIDLYLAKHYEELATKVDHWMGKHEQDMDIKSRELHDLKVSRGELRLTFDDTFPCVTSGEE